jgi:hypothetical protein
LAALGLLVPVASIVAIGDMPDVTMAILGSHRKISFFKVEVTRISGISAPLKVVPVAHSIVKLELGVRV